MLHYVARPWHPPWIRQWYVYKEESIPVGCVPPVCQPYVFRWPPLDASTDGLDGGGLMSNVGKGKGRSTGEGCGGCTVRSNASRLLVTWDPPPWADRRLWKHYLPATSFAGDNDDSETSLKIHFVFIEYFTTNTKLWRVLRMNVCHQQEGISIECLPPACRQYGLHSEQVWTCLEGMALHGREPVERGGLVNWGPTQGFFPGQTELLTGGQTRTKTLPTRKFVGGGKIQIVFSIDTDLIC